MADLISRKALVTKLSQGYWDKNLQQAKNDPCVIDAMIDWAIRIVNEMPLESPWHTGTPTEEGLYVVLTKITTIGIHSSEGTYILDWWDGFSFQNLKKMAMHNPVFGSETYSWIKWQKIEED